MRYQAKTNSIYKAIPKSTKRGSIFLAHVINGDIPQEARCLTLCRKTTAKEIIHKVTYELEGNIFIKDIKII